MVIYTIIITVCKVGAIWGRTVIIRKTFQSIGTVVFMIMIIDTNNRKIKQQEKYDRWTNRKIHAKSRHSHSND